MHNRAHRNPWWAATLLALAGHASQPLAQPRTGVDYTDWWARGSDFVIGRLQVSPTERVQVTYSGQNETAVLGTISEPYWGPASTYMGTRMANPPPDSDLIVIAGGAGSGRMRVTFSEAVTDPVLAITSLGLINNAGTIRIQTAMFFDQPFEVVSTGQGGRPLFTPFLTNPGDNRTLFGTESAGLIRFRGTFTELSWTSPLAEINEFGNLVGTYMVTVGSAGCHDYELAPLTAATRVRQGCSAYTRGSFAQQARLDVAGKLTAYGAYQVAQVLDVAATGRMDYQGGLDVAAGGRLQLAGLLRGSATGAVSGAVDALPGSQWEHLGALVVAPEGRLDLAGNVTWWGPASINGSVRLSPGGVLTAAQPLLVGGAGARLDVAAGARAELPSGLQASSGAAVQVAGQLNAAGGLQLHQATLGVQAGGELVAGGAVELDATVSNRGRLRLVSAQSVIGPNATITNLGLFEANGGRLSLQAGSLFNNVGTGQLLLDGATLALQGGGLNNLALLATAGATRIEGGGAALNNVGTLQVQAGSTLALGGGARIQDGGGRIQVDGGGTLVLESDARRLMLDQGRLRLAPGSRMEVQATGELGVAGSGRADVDGTLVLRPSAQLTNSGRVFVNPLGRVEVDGGASITTGGLSFEVYGHVIGGGTFTQLGGTVLIDGEMSLPLMVFESGVLQGNGTVSGRAVLGSVVNASRLVLSPGRSPGRLSFSDAVELDSVLLDMEVDERRRFDQLVFQGALAVNDAVLSVRPSADYVPDLDDRFAFLQSQRGMPALAFGTAPLPGILVVDTSALPQDWSAPWMALGPAAGLSLSLDRAYEMALPAAPRDLAFVPAGDFAWARDAALAGMLQVNGRFTHRDNGLDPVTGAPLPSLLTLLPGAYLSVGAGGHFSTRSVLVNQGFVRNDGRVDVRSGAAWSNAGAIENAGRWFHDGQMDGAGQFVNLPGAEFTSFGTIEVAGDWYNQGLLRLAQGRMVHGGRLVNAGSGRLQVDAGAELAGTGQLEQTDQAVATVDGRLALAQVLMIGGTLQGKGVVEGEVTLAGGLIVKPGGDDIGTLSLAGTVTIDGLRLDLDLGSGSMDLLDMSRAGVFVYGQGLSVRLWLTPGLSPQAGQQLTLFTFDGDNSFVPLDAITLQTWQHTAEGDRPWSAGPGLALDLALAPGAVTLNVSALPVPEPGAAALMLAGLGVLLGLRRRRR